MIDHFGVKVATQAQLIEKADYIGENKGRKQDRQALHFELQLVFKVLADCMDQDQVARNESNRDNCQERARHQSSRLEPEIDLILQVLDWCAVSIFYLNAHCVVNLNGPAN